jgi:methyl-accepting chemotaxis protein
MTIRVASALSKGSVTEVVDSLCGQLIDKLAGETPRLLLVFGSTLQPLEQLAPELALRMPTATLLAASTAGEFTEAGDAKGATSVLAVAGDVRAFAGIGRGLKDNPESAVRVALEGLPRELAGYPHSTAFLLLDPLAGASEEATLFASMMLGPNVRLVGGAAGDDLQMKRTLVACGAEVASDAVVIGFVFSKHALGVGVSHGHTPLSQPLTITRAEGGRVISVAGRPAWDVWLEQTQAQAAQDGIDVASLAVAQEGGFLLRYEAGLSSGGGYKIRAPLSRNADGSIEFACAVPEGAVIRIMRSDPEGQVESATRAARLALEQLGGSPVVGAVVFDCICRNLILGSRFSEAIDGISSVLGRVPLAGFETYGEIALDVGDMSGFHNTTSVVLAFAGQ